jgi:hypothetical protein
MNHRWTADIVNDPSKESALRVDISRNDEHRATILRAADGELVLRWYATEADEDVPLQWLLAVLEKANHELPG